MKGPVWKLAGIWMLAWATTAAASERCAELEAAHTALLASSFSVERHFSLRMNGELKAMEIARLTRWNGELTREVLEREVLDKNLVMDEGEGEAVLNIPYACERILEVEEGIFELTSRDGLERVTFSLNEERGALVPVSWRNEESVRFLWKKIRIDATADYIGFEWN